MQIRTLTVDELRAFYREHLARSFPRDELKPLRAMEQMLPTGRYHVRGIDDGGTVTGIATAYCMEPGWALFDYLCVAPEYRGRGLGAKLVSSLCRAERERILFGESEEPSYAPDPAVAERRLAFYRRCGARDAGYRMTLFGVVYRVLYWAGRDVPAAEIAARHAAAYRQRFPDAVYRKFVAIPWSPADGVPTPVDWTELEEDAK